MINTIYTHDMSRYVLDRLKVFDGKKCNLMIPGGSLLALLDADELTKYDASRWRIYFSDERSDKNNLNSKDAKVFLDKIKAREIIVDYKCIHNTNDNNTTNTNNEVLSGPIVYVIDSLNPSGHKCYNILLQNVCIDLCLLGVGENGHTCSIWPNSKESIVDEEEKIEYKCNNNSNINSNCNTCNNNCNNNKNCNGCNTCNNSYDLLFVKTTVDDTFPHRMTCTTRFLNQRISVIYFCLPPKDGKVKKVKSPDRSIMEKLNKVNCNIILYGDK